MIHQKRNEKEIAALGKQFGLVTPYTSLLVLDSLEQYVQYEIAPPKSLAAMREEYMRRIDTVEHQRQKQKADKLAEVLRMWEERVKWWNAEFKYAKDFKYKEPQDRRGAGEAVTLTATDPGSAPAASCRTIGGSPAAVARRACAAGGRDRRSAAALLRPAPPRPVHRPRDAHACDVPSLPRRAAASARHRCACAARGCRRPASASPAPAMRTPRQSGYIGDATRRANGKTGGEGRAQSGQSSARQPGIVIKPWQPDTPYLKELQAAKGKADLFAVYMKNRAKYGTSPGFFLDCADFFREAGDSEMALQVLSNIAELELEDAALLRVLGHRLVQIGQLDLAVQTFEQVLELRPEEPQSYRDLALALARRAEQTRKVSTISSRLTDSP